MTQAPISLEPSPDPSGYDGGVSAPASEQIFTAKQVSGRLGLSSAMTRRYGAALEQLTGEPIRQHPRDGRQYRADQVEVLLQAKALVEANPRLSVAQALQLALGGVPAVVATSVVAEGSGTASEALAEALERTLLPELRALREEVVGLRREMRDQGSGQEVFHTLPDRAGNSPAPSTAKAERAATADNEIKVKGLARNETDGLMVQLARRLEQLLRRGGRS